LVNSQVDNIVANAKRAARIARSANVPADTLLARSLTPTEPAILAKQARYDVLADHDASWADPNHFSQVALGLKCALAARREGKLIDPRNLTGAVVEISLLDWLKSFPDDMSDDEIRTAARELEMRVLKSNVARGELGALDQPFTLEEFKPRASGSHVLDKITEEPSELSRRLSENHLGIGEDEVERRKAGLAIMRGQLAGLEAVGARASGNSVETPDRPAPIVAAQSKRKPGLRHLHELWKGDKQLSQKTIDDNRLYIERFIDIIGDLPIDQITRQHIRKFRDTLKQYPRSPPDEYARGRVDDAIAWAKANPKAKLLSKQTINAKALGSISLLFDVALLESFVDANPCQKLRLDTKDDGDTGRLPFDSTDFEKLFRSPLYADEEWLPKTGGYEAAFWIPLIALFEGARLEEIGQLLVWDIKHFENKYYFDITTLEDANYEGSDAPNPLTRTAPRVSEKKSMKTLSSRRRIPVHKVLIDLGFLDFVARRQREGGERLFRHLQDYRGRRTKNWSRWWGRYQNKYVTKMPEKVFHSFRHNFKDALIAANVADDHRKALMGHSNNDVTSGYGLGFPILVLAPEIEKISYAVIDVAAIRKVAAKAI
jgi:hypothetical protein